MKQPETQREKESERNSEKDHEDGKKMEGESWEKCLLEQQGKEWRG